MFINGGVYMKTNYQAPDLELIKFSMVDFILSASNNTDPEETIPDVGGEEDFTIPELEI